MIRERRTDKCNGPQIIVFGRSLGGAVAFHVAADNPGKINSLIVENTFWSIEAVTGKVTEMMMTSKVIVIVSVTTLLVIKAMLMLTTAITQNRLQHQC